VSKKIFFVFLILISFVYLFLRLYQLPSLLGFHQDQGIHLLETKAMFDSQKISLVGPMVTSKSADGRNFFIGGNYYYVLGIVGLICRWNPLAITIFFIILEFLFYLFFIFFLKKKFSYFSVLLTFLFISISPYLVIHSRFFWNPHLLVPLSILAIFCLDKFLSQKKIKYLFLASFLWGFAFACHYSAVFWAIFFIFILLKNKNFLKLKNYFSILFGFFVGNLPFFIFEIRHQFYNLKTLFYVYTHSSQSGELTSHYFVFSLLIFIIFILLYFLNKLKNKNIYLFLVLSLILTIQFKIFKNYQPTDTIIGWNYSDQQKVANIISQNCPHNFNIAATMQGDTRFYDLRFLLTAKNCLPNGVKNYPESQKIFLVAKNDHSPESETVWEINSYKSFKITQKISINDKLNLYELTK